MHSPQQLNRRSFLGAALATPALVALLAACASDNKTGSGGISHASGRDDQLVRIGFEGGFTAPSYQFTRVPTLLISGDGRVILPGAQTEQFPGPLLPALFERSITEAGIQKVLELADAAKLLQPPPDYTAPMNVADAPDTVVVLAANGQTYRHSAYALGMGEPEVTPARKALSGFVTTMGDIDKVAGAANLGEGKPYVAESYRMQARALTAVDLSGYEPAPQIVAWPTGTGVLLASAATCVVVPAAKVDAVFKTATQTTFFTEDGVTYEVVAIAKLPGDVC